MSGKLGRASVGGHQRSAGDAEKDRLIWRYRAVAIPKGDDEPMPGSSRADWRQRMASRAADLRGWRTGDLARRRKGRRLGDGDRRIDRSRTILLFIW
jgi:hypothetical protein